MKTLFRNLIAVLVLLGAFSQVNAQSMFVYQDTQINADGKTADVFVGVPVKIQKDMGKEVKVVIEGYRVKDKVYSSKSKELLVAKINDGFKVTTKGEKVQLVGTISKELISNDLLDVWGEHEEFYFEMCTQCHAGPEVSHHSMMEWGAIFGTMKGFAKLDTEEASYLLRYLKANASDGFVKVKH